jgi:RimJ/RimL family protein N-acetyltransferase
VSWERLREPLEGRLVVLEPLQETHLDELRAAGADERIWRYMPVAPYETWLEWTLAEVRAGVRVAFAVVHGGRAVGSTSYGNYAPEHLRVEVGGTWNNPSTWNSGVNVEAKYLLMRHAFEEVGLRRVEFETEAANERARAALAALPAEFEGVFRKHMIVRGGERRDSAWYAVIDDDWPEVKANLERRLKIR